MSMYLIKSRRPKVDVKPRVQRIYRVLEGKRRKCEIHIFNLEGLVGIIRAIDYFLTPEQALNILKFYTRINPLMLYSSNHNKKAMVASFDPSNNIDYVNELSEEDIQGTQYIVGYRHQYHRTPIWDLVETQSAEQAFKNIVRSRMHIPDGKCIEDPLKNYREGNSLDEVTVYTLLSEGLDRELSWHRRWSQDPTVIRL